MNLKNLLNKPVGVLGSGYFGTAIANLLAHNAEVIMHVYSSDSLETIQKTGISAEQNLSEKITLTNSMQKIADECDVIFAIIPSEFFKSSIQQIAPYIKDNHIIIHGTKGLEVNFLNKENLSRENIRTMSEILSTETTCNKIGCISGPNLAKELAKGDPAGVVLASKNSEVLTIGKKYLGSPNFKVFNSTDIIGTELCGVLKNAIAIAIGFVSGMNYGYNTKGLIISLGLNEITLIGKKIGAESDSFIGVAGIGDLVATSFSTNSRNHSLGYKLATGHKLQDILNEKTQAIEGINTVKTLYFLAKNYHIDTPIISTLYKLLFENMSTEQVMNSFLK